MLRFDVKLSTTEQTQIGIQGYVHVHANHTLYNSVSYEMLIGPRTTIMVIT